MCSPSKRCQARSIRVTRSTKRATSPHWYSCQTRDGVERHATFKWGMSVRVRPRCCDPVRVVQAAEHPHFSAVACRYNARCIWWRAAGALACGNHGDRSFCPASPMVKTLASQARSAGFDPRVCGQIQRRATNSTDAVRLRAEVPMYSASWARLRLQNERGRVRLPSCTRHRGDQGGRQPHKLTDDGSNPSIATTCGGAHLVM